MNNRNNGAFILSRSIFESDIWIFKPAEWLKIWIYILGKVNFIDNGVFKRGEQLFKYEYISRDCGVSYDTVRRCIKSIEEANQISTKRTTRGLIIKVNNYEEYQNFDSYSQSKANQKPIKSQSSTHSIIEECNNERKKDSNTYTLKPDIYSENEVLNTAICEWIQYKKEKKDGYKPTGLKNFITLCKKYTPESVIEQMERAMASGWKGVQWKDCVMIPYIDKRFDFSNPETYDPDLWRKELEKNPKLWEQLRYQNEPIYRKFKKQIEHFNSLLS